MKITRRLLLVFFLLSPLTLSSLGDPAPAHTYTDKTGSKGIYAFDFDPYTGKLTPKGLAAETPNPSWIAVHPNGKWVYAANESGKQSAISSFSVEHASGKLTLLNQLPSEGEDPCYLSFDKTGKYLFVANYTSGTVAVFPILVNGKLAEHSSEVKDGRALGPNKERQDGPHAHWIEASADNQLVYYTDLGLDAFQRTGFDPATGRFVLEFVWLSGLPPGTGPRHAVFSPDGRFAYVLGELNSTVSLVSYDYKPALKVWQTVSTLPSDFHSRNDAAEIALHASGKWLFASNRGHDSISVFAIDPKTRMLTSAGIFPTGGKEPRHFALDPTGQFLLAENQYSNNIVVFRSDPATGALTEVSRTDNIPSPVCLVFLP